MPPATRSPATAKRSARSSRQPARPDPTPLATSAPAAEGRYLMLISVHGLIRGHDLELGRDADTGGQTKYVVELARALAASADIGRVELVTRLVDDQRVSPDYASPQEDLGPNVRIIRIRCGPRRYLAKESLWPHLDSFVDNTVLYLRSLGRVPDLIHGHYADAGYVAARLAGLLNVPMAFTGHSLGRVKQQRLREQGMSLDTIEKRYRIGRRIEAEETALDNAAFVVTSTHQEVEQQYELYDHYQPRRMLVIPPGVDLTRYSPPPPRKKFDPPMAAQLARFLRDPRKPMILALSRPDHRKNIPTLVHAFGGSPELREKANLVLVAGNRHKIREIDKGSREVLSELLFLIDDYDLWGQVAFPKQHDAQDVPDFYRLAADTKGVFINPALTEPFGLTLLEAAASGLPIVATEDGGPRDIIAHCHNGVLVDPLDVDAIRAALLNAVSNKAQWRKWSRAGLKGAQEHFSWDAHVGKLVRAANTAITSAERQAVRTRRSIKNRLITANRFVICDVDDTLIGDQDALKQFLHRLEEQGDRVGFGIATGRNMESTLKALRRWNVPIPQLLITGVGTQIHYGQQLIEDRGWTHHIHYRWRPDQVREAMNSFPSLTPQPDSVQTPFKLSYYVDRNDVPDTEAIVRHLRRNNLQASVIFSHNAYIDLLPIRASKGMALRHFALRWDIPLERCLVAGDSGNDESMLTGNMRSVVVGNHEPELEPLRQAANVYFAEGRYAWGILEGIDYYDFFGNIRRPEPEVESQTNE